MHLIGELWKKHMTEHGTACEAVRSWQNAEAQSQEPQQEGELLAPPKADDGKRMCDEANAIAEGKILERFGMQPAKRGCKKDRRQRPRPSNGARAEAGSSAGLPVFARVSASISADALSIRKTIELEPDSPRPVLTAIKGSRLCLSSDPKHVAVAAGSHGSIPLSVIALDHPYVATLLLVPAIHVRLASPRACGARTARA
ncbi:hypothetical protein P280DRAFT_477799 [Massarina eburnea CBS 473.64]|uniref:Uncharacterized protein n=1 Tax=Massarina eburnea CBS 473.64 TaxID=1395130 RepID=A0A6A6S7F8_9PLEO|nr:hypothetical protein P280DRAFT_477799 [Massarina eburnea CBS 473.64]